MCHRSNSKFRFARPIQRHANQPKTHLGRFKTHPKLSSKPYSVRTYLQTSIQAKPENQKKYKAHASCSCLWKWVGGGRAASES